MGAAMAKEFRSIGDMNFAAAAAAEIPIITHAPLPKTRRRTPEPEYMPVASRAPETSLRRLEVLLAHAGSPELGTSIGFMKMRGDITEAQWGACDWFAQLYGRYMVAIDAKGVKSGSAEMTSKAEPPDPFTSDAGKKTAKKDEATVKEYRAAELAALVCGRGNFLMFLDVVIDDAVPTWPARRAVEEVATALAIHRRRESKRRRGRQGR